MSPVFLSYEGDAMLFKDPIRTIQTEVPTGWAFDPFNSTLTDFVFCRWDQPQEMIVAHVRRASIPSSRSDEEWIGKIRAETAGKAHLTELPLEHGCAVSAEFTSNRGWAQRVAFVRGPQVELVIEQRSTTQTAPNQWQPLEQAVRTASSGANLDLPEDGGPGEFSRSVEAVNQAFENDDPEEIAEALRRSIQAGTSAWLRSMALPDGALEINAAVRTAQAMLHLGLFTGDQAMARDADFLLRRAQHSLEAAGIEADWAQELGKQISATLQNIWSGLLDPSEPESSANMLHILSLRERGFHSTQAAATAFEARDPEKALGLAEMAANDLLSLIAFLRQNRTQEIPADIAEHLSGQGITDEEQQKDAIQKAREALLFPPLNMALQIRHCCALERGSVAMAAETTAVRLPLARQIFSSSPDDASAVLNLALAMMDCTGIAALDADGGRLDEASLSLDGAIQLLNLIGERRGSDDRWILYHKSHTDAALLAIDRGLASAEHRRDAGRAQDISALRARLEAVIAQFREAAIKSAPEFR